MDVKQLVNEGAALKAQIDAATERLRGINAQLAEVLDFDGGKTARALGSSVIAKVVLRENVKWDQERLALVAGHFPEAFNVAFRPEYKPAPQKIFKAALAAQEFANAVRWAKIVTPGAPSVTFEPLEEEVPC